MRKISVWVVAVAVLPLLSVAVFGSVVTTPLLNSAGLSSGWDVTYDNATTGVTVDAVAGGIVTIQLAKNFTGGPNPVTGLLPSIDVTFTQYLSNANTMPTIVVANESITNNTSVNWNNFEWNLEDEGSAVFNIAQSGVFGTQPSPQFQAQIWRDASGNPIPTSVNPAVELDAVTGLVAIGTAYQPGTLDPGPSGQLVIDTVLDGDASFVLKETPTFTQVPEPATMTLLGLGLGGLLLRRRRLQHA